MPKAFYLIKHGPATSAFALRELPARVLLPNEVRIQVEGFGLNFADVMSRLGQYRECPPLPTVIGYEVVGTVAETGADVTDLSVGERVLAFTRFGGYAEEVVTDYRGVVSIPTAWPIAFATALGTQYATAWYAATYITRLHPGERVLIHAAAGGVGTALVQIAKHAGCEVWGTAGSAEKLAYLESLGVDHPINYREKPFSSTIVASLGKRERLDVIFDPIGGKTSRQGFQLLGSGGRLVLYGAASLTGKNNMVAKLRFAWQMGLYHPIQLMMRSKSILGVNMLKVGDYRPVALQQVLQEVVDGAKQGMLQPKATQLFTADDLPKAHTMLEKRQTTGKVAIAW